MKGIVIADERLYVAGRLPVAKTLANVVAVYSVNGGRPLDQHIIDDEFVHDCLAVAGGRVYVTTQGGKLICLGEE